MQFEQASCEEEMIGLFLRSEISSVRWRPRLLEILHELKCPVSLLEEPDVTREEHNELRVRVLACFRGYGRNRDLFEDYPADVAWHWVRLEREELSRIKYVDYDYWDLLSRGSRRPLDAAQTIRDGVEVCGVSNRGSLEGAEAVRHGVTFIEPILVAPDPEGDLVILEGHGRMTAYALAGEDAPQQIRALLGLSPGFSAWL
jgi:hypothetical protein